MKSLWDNLKDKTPPELAPGAVHVFWSDQVQNWVQVMPKQGESPEEAKKRVMGNHGLNPAGS
jgi:hypothetical protein